MMIDRTPKPAPDPATPKPDIESVLVAMLAAAQAAGESFLDVTARELCTAVNDPTAGSNGVDKCGRIMKRMMIPGDYDLSSLHGPNKTKLLIRFRLPR
jgi:hypothetical protein